MSVTIEREKFAVVLFLIDRLHLIPEREKEQYVLYCLTLCFVCQY